MATKQKIIPGTTPLYDFSNKYTRKKELDAAKAGYSNMEELHDTAFLSVFFSREFWNASLDTVGKYMNELVTGKRLKKAEANLKQEQMLFDAANRLYQLTGHQPGEKSGVVKNEKIADKKAAENMRAVKISAAMALAYGNDDDKKKQVMQDIKNKYPELIKEIQELAKKAKERVKNDEFKKATVGLKFGKTSNESFKINEFGEIIRGGR